MPYITPPPTQPVNLTPETVQQLSVEDAPGVLERGDITDFIRKCILRHVIRHSIRDNEAQQIVTDVTIHDLQSHSTIFSHNGNTQQFAASVNKLPVVLLILQELRAGNITLDQVVHWEASDVRAGAGVYDQPGAPLEASVQDVIYDLLNRSGNTAVRILVNRLLGGAAAVNERWSQIPQLSNTRLQPLDANRFFVGNSTSNDSIWVMEELVKTDDHYARVIKEALRTNIYTDIGVRSQLAGNDFIVLVNKVGLLDDVDGNNRHDVGIIYNTKTHKSYSYSLFTTSPNASETATEQAEKSIQDMGRALLRFSGDKRQAGTPPHTLKAPIAPEGRILY